MKVLYVSHTSQISGAERSLLDLLAALPPDVQALAAAPHGALRQAISRQGTSVRAITGTAGSLRLHPLHTPRALLEMGAAALQLRRATRALGADIVHANSIRAGIALSLARPSAAVRVVHVRDCLPPGALSTTTMRLIAAGAHVIVANSRYTADWVWRAAPRARVEVLHNGVDLERFDPARVDRARARARIGVPGTGSLLLGVLAQLTPWKGQDTAIEALRLLRDDGVDAHLVLVGSVKFADRATRFDNDAYVRRLRGLIAGAGLEQRVSWLGEREDVADVLGALDMLLLPSWQEPFGRALIEAMALGVPVLATSVGGAPEIVSDGVEGLLVEPKLPQAWAAAIGALAADPQRRARMGEAGRRRVQRDFSLAGHVSALLGLYARELERLSGSTSRPAGAAVQS